MGVEGAVSRGALPTILVLGSIPPPYQGVSVAMGQLLGSAARGSYALRHIDTTRRGQEPTGRVRWEKLAKDAGLFASLTRALRRERIDIVYLALSQVPLGALRDAAVISLARAAGARVVGHLHGAHFRRMYDALDPVRRRVVRAGIRRLDGAIVLGEMLRPIFDGLVEPRRVHVVHNGVPADAVPPEALEEADGRRRGRDGLRIVFLSNLFEAKGFLDLVEACALLRDRGVAFEAVFAGAWESDAVRRRATDRVRALALEDRCRFPGVVAGAEKWQLLLESDVFALPTRYPIEGQPIAIIEAMAAGLPVIATARGCIPEMVADGRNGFIIDEGDIDGLARRLAELAAAPARRIEMGRASRAQYLDRYTEEAYLSGLYAVFDDVRRNGCR